MMIRCATQRKDTAAVSFAQFTALSRRILILSLVLLLIYLTISTSSLTWDICCHMGFLCWPSNWFLVNQVLLDNPPIVAVDGLKMTSGISHIYIFDTCSKGKPIAKSAFIACSDIHHIYQAMNLPSADERIWSRTAGSQSFPYSGFYTHHSR